MTGFSKGIGLILLAAWFFAGSAPAWAVTAPRFQSLGQIRDAFIAPTRLDVDDQGNLYVVDARKKTVFKFDKFGAKSKGIQAFTEAEASGGGLAVSGDGKRLFVAERQSVAVLDGTTGARLGYLGGQNRFAHVYDIALDADGHIFVADAERLTIEAYRPGGQDPLVPYVFDYQFGAKGTAPGQFMGIAAMEINRAAGEVYVADPNFHKPTGARTILSYPKVQVFDLAGNLKKINGITNFILLGSKSFGSKEMIYFGGMTFDGQGRGYFSDSYNGRVNVLNVTGTDPLRMYLSSYAVAGFRIGQLSDPRDQVFDPLTGRLFVLCGDGRVEIFGIDGAVNPVNANEAPEAPVPVSPVGRGEVPSLMPTLSWQEAIDADGDELTYRVKIGEEGAAAETFEEIAGTSFVLPRELRENAAYVWSVQAFDGEAASAWSDTQAFFVNAEEEAPMAPELTAPDSGNTADGLTVFSWQAATDPDPFETLTYVLQVAADESFAMPVLEETLGVTSLALGDCADYFELEDGQDYFWRVTAVDSTDLESAPGEARPFTYDSTILAVSANVSGARVHLGGNFGYPGQFMGETPLELRDFPVGPCALVVEHPGFEPAVAAIKVEERRGAQAQVQLIPALVPDKFTEREPLRAGTGRLRTEGEAAPYWADFDHDGISDLLVGTASGQLLLYSGQSEDGSRYGEGEALPLGMTVPGAMPVLVDWDNDLRKDLLVGAADGTLTLFLNQGSESAPVFAEGMLLTDGNGVIDVGDGAAPVVVDFDGDNKKDLLVGSADGRLVRFHNEGPDAGPRLARVEFALEGLGTAPVAPFMVDWNGDGRRDLLLAQDGRFLVFPRLENGSFAPAEDVEVAGRLAGGTPQRIFVADTDGKKGKDIFVGGEDGEVRLLQGNAKLLAPAFMQFMLKKMDNLAEELVEDRRIQADVVAIRAQLEKNNLRAASEKMETLYRKVARNQEVAAQVAEARDLLLLAEAAGE